MELTAVIEALIFASPEPVSSAALARCLRPATRKEDSAGDAESVPRIDSRAIEDAVGQLNRQYEEQGRAFHIVAEAGGWRFLSHPDFAPWIERLLPDRRPSRLSPAALETLAIIAYRQPITKSGVEAIRGVGIDGVLQTVLDRGLVRTVGRAALPGRPVLYGTTELFLEHFGIWDLDDLPNAEELRFTPIPALKDGSASPGETSPAQKQMKLEGLSGENGKTNPPKRLSPVAAARKLAESQETSLFSLHPPTHP